MTSINKDVFIAEIFLEKLFLLFWLSEKGQNSINDDKYDKNHNEVFDP